MNPKVSVIIPCYNEPEDVFRRSVESVTAQTLKDIEIIIVLDNPDNTELREIIGDYQRVFDNILLLTPEKNLGRGNARNLAIGSAQWKHIAIHDADDIDMPRRLEEQFTHMEQNPQIWATFSAIQNMDEHWEVIPQTLTVPSVDAKSFFLKWLNHQTMFIRSQVLRSLGWYKDINFGEDVDLWMRMFIEDIKISGIETVHTHYLTPLESTHSDSIEKLKKWRITSLEFYRAYFKYLVKDPVFIRLFITNLLDYAALHMGRKNYVRYRNAIQRLKQKND